MFLVVMMMCTVNSQVLENCRPVKMAIVQAPSQRECMVAMMQVSMKLRVIYPNIRATEVACIPVEET